MTQVQLNITQPVPSGIPSGPDGDALLLLDREDVSRCGGGMRVPQHSRCQGWLGSPLVALGAGDEPVDHMLPNQSPAPAGPSPSSKRRRPPSLLDLQASFLSKPSRRHVCAAPIPFPILPPYPLPRPVRPRILEAPAIARTSATVQDDRPRLGLARLPLNAPTPRRETEAYIKTLATPPPAGSPYALPLPGTERPNRTAVYRHWRFQKGPLLETFSPEHQTLHDLFESSAAAYAGKDCLGWRPWNPVSKTYEPRYTWISYGQVAERRKNFGAGVVELHKRVGVTDDKYGVGLWSQNSAEWQISELALVSQSLWPVSLYETLGPETSEYIINHGGLTAIICSVNHIPTLLKLAPRVPSLKLIISLDPLDAGEPAGMSKLDLLNASAKAVGLQIFSMEDVEAIGARSGRPMRPPTRSDIVTINYTSGTTGDPKGVLITHANAVAGISAARSNDTVRPTDTHISYLPLAHIYGRMVDQTVLAVGARIGYFHGDIAGLVEDMKILRPNGIFSVPRLYNRFNSAVQAATIQSDGVKGALSRRVIETKKANMQLGQGKAYNTHFLFDRIWTPKVLKGIGLDRARTMCSGSAQLDPDVHNFLRAAFGNTFVQGFGMTETYAVGTVQLRDDFTTGNIGPPCPSVELCIESVPDYEYTVEDKPYPRGELLMRGPIIFQEYFRNPEETAKTIEADGWFHTGDIVEVDSMGRFKIIDRKKNVLKLAQGEYISPERIENVYMGSTSLLATAFVHGDPKEASLVAVFGVDPVQFAPYASRILKKEVAVDDKAGLRAAANDPRVKSTFMKLLDKIGKGHKFNKFEMVKNCYFDVEPFTIENELLTPTLKLKRPQTAKAFRAEIDRMYEELAADATSKPKL